VSLVPLSQLFPAGRPESALIARRDGRALTMARLAADVAGNAARLERHGADRALLAAEDGYWFLVGLLALLQIGAEIVMPPNAQPQTLSALRRDGDPVVTDRAVSHDGAVLLQPAEGGPTRALQHLDPARCRFSFFTSGSTGERKRIEKTLAQLETEAVVLETLWGESLRDASVFGMVGPQHIFGLTFRLIWPAIAGRPFEANLYFAWESLLGVLTRPEMLVVSPAHLTRIDGLAALEPGRRPRAVFTAGAPLSLEAARAAATLLGELPVEIFGSTETGAIAWRRQTALDIPWRPLPGMKVTAGADGVLELTSPFLPPGDTYRGADRIEPTQDGFHFRGRTDRIVKIEGKRVALAEIERDLQGLPWVREAAVVPLRAQQSYLAAALVLSPAGRQELARHGKFRFTRQLREALGARHDRAGLPRRWRFLEALPRDDMGKCQAAVVAALFLAETGRPA
jgi:acyl-coenzyme A synthetase/AMP-(fatty) acid ligase